MQCGDSGAVGVLNLELMVQRITYNYADYDHPSFIKTDYLGTRDKLSDSYNFWNHDAEFIAAANPATVLALLDALENCREILEFISATDLKNIDTPGHWYRKDLAVKALQELKEILGE